MFYLAQAGSALQVIDTDGTITQTLTLPSGITIDANTRGIFAILGQQVLFVAAPTVNLWIDPTDFTVRRLGVRPPSSAPTLAAGSGTGLTGDFRVRVSFAVKDAAGVVLNESPLGPPTAPMTLADQDLSLTDLPLSDDTDVNCRRVYRTTAGGAVYFLDFDLDDNDTTELTTATPDAALELLPADPELGNPPGTVPGTALDLLVTWRNRLWAKSRRLDEVDKILFSDAEKFYAFATSNFLLATPVGEDTFGITGYLPRRDELVVCKRNRIMKVTGTNEDDFQVVVIAVGAGCLAPDSTIVVRDVGYFLGLDGIYTISNEGLKCVSRDKVDPWFLTDDYFNRSLFPYAIGAYNPITDTYDLQLAAAGSDVLDRWVSYDIRRKEFLGPHLTSAFTPVSRALLQAASGEARPVLGDTAGFLWQMNQSGASDGGTAIAIDWITKHFSGRAPDIFHFWGQPTFYTRSLGLGASSVTITPRVGTMDATDGTPILLSLAKDRTVTRRLGPGELVRLQFTHAVDGDDVDLRGFELPFIEVGRRISGR